MIKFEKETISSKTERDGEQERYNSIRSALNKKAEADWKYIKELTLSPEERGANERFESCRAKYGNAEFHDAKINIYDEALEQSNNSQYEGLLMNKLFFELSRINGEVMVQIRVGNLPEEGLKRLRFQSYEDARELVRSVSETVGKEKAQLVLDRWHEGVEPSRDYLAHLLKV